MRLIDADALYDVFEEKYKNANGAYRTAFREALNDICDAPTIDATPVIHARWKGPDEPPHIKGAVCSNCGKVDIGGDYCRNCGAKMDSVNPADLFDG